MQWEFELHTDEPDDADNSWSPPGEAEAIWAVGTPPGLDTEEWTIALRFVVQDDHPILAEVRFFPTEDSPSDQTQGEWSSDPNAVPTLGLPAAVVKNVALFDLETQVRASLANWKHPTWGVGETRPDDFGEPPESYQEWSDLTDRTGIDTDDTTHRRKRGRPPLTDEHLAIVAYHYVQALRTGEGVHNYIWSQMNEGGETLPIGQWIKKARERGFLTATPKPGQRGGDMTQKTFDVLDRIGFPTEQDTGGTPQGGDDK
jgi:hypothetical protein